MTGDFQKHRRSVSSSEPGWEGGEGPCQRQCEKQGTEPGQSGNTRPPVTVKWAFQGKFSLYSTYPCFKKIIKSQAKMGCVLILR